MRMRPGRPTYGDDEGAVAVIVVICLIAIFAMVVLTVDVGNLLFTRRAMVNASDAGALAAAQSCVHPRAEWADPKVGQPEVKADEYAAPNAAGVATSGKNIVDAQTRGCGTSSNGYTTVRYSVVKDLFFAGIFGKSQSPVTTVATATWGPTGAINPIPLVIYQGFFQGQCDVPNVQPGVTCYLWEDNNLSGTGNFGFLDVGNGWDPANGPRPSNNDCTNSGGDGALKGWIDTSGLGNPLSLHYPYATWACARAGNHSEPQVWDSLRALIGQTRDFPIVGTSPADGEPQQITNPNAYNVIGFAHMQIVDVITVQNTAPIGATCAIPKASVSPVDLLACAGAPAGATYSPLPNAKVTPGTFQTWTESATGIFSWTGTLPQGGLSVDFQYKIPSTDCNGVPAPNSSAHCLVLRWNGSTLDGGDPGGGADFGLRAIKLCEIGYGSCLGG